MELKTMRNVEGAIRDAGYLLEEADRRISEADRRLQWAMAQLPKLSPGDRPGLRLRIHEARAHRFPSLIPPTKEQKKAAGGPKDPKAWASMAEAALESAGQYLAVARRNIDALEEEIPITRGMLSGQASAVSDAAEQLWSRLDGVGALELGRDAADAIPYATEPGRICEMKALPDGDHLTGFIRISAEIERTLMLAWLTRDRAAVGAEGLEDYVSNQVSEWLEDLATNRPGMLVDTREVTALLLNYAHALDVDRGRIAAMEKPDPGLGLSSEDVVRGAKAFTKPNEVPQGGERPPDTTFRREEIQ